MIGYAYGDDLEPLPPSYDEDDEDAEFTDEPVAPLCYHWFCYGICKNGSSCSRVHKRLEEATPAEIEALKADMSRIKCRYGISCTDKWCFRNHYGSDAADGPRAVVLAPIVDQVVDGPAWDGGAYAAHLRSEYF